ncbi:MAG: DUF4142 domain-containing protein [Planctomycetes bacterium]|nr:DUF4142 domain-containing protein [Planctomycetota bacterium]
MAILGYWSGSATADEVDRELDGDFLVKVMAIDIAEIEIGKLADKRSNSLQVKDRAGRLVNEHRKSADRVGLMLKNRQQSIVTGFDKNLLHLREDLGRLQGSEFDREYLRWTISTHQKEIAMYENQIKNGREGEIRSFAQEHVTVLRDHLRRAQELLKDIN